MAFDLKDKRVTIIGAGRSGLAAAEVVRTLGGIPFVSDSDAKLESVVGPGLVDSGIESEFGRHSDRIYDCDMMIISPGIPSDSEIVIRAKTAGITVWPEVELAYRICKGTIIGVTGSNGKTTTTTLIGEILKNAGHEVFACGNIGNPFILSASRISLSGYAVVELSSFQLEMIDRFRPHIAVFLNVTPDHLDRHGDFETYLGAKARIFENQESDDMAIINFDDKILRERFRSLKAETTWFSVESRIPDGIFGEPSGNITAAGKTVIKADRIKIKGLHNLSNVCAAVAAALSAGVDVEVIARAIESFPGVEHRLEPVRLIGGVSFINDSKGTNVDSVRWALLAVSAPVILIAGGKDKGGDFSQLNDLIAERVRKVVLIGQAAEKIKKTWRDIVECVFADNMETAVKTAYESANNGDTVLLSPGCASFDMYDNFEHRGRVFKAAVNELESSGVAG